MRILLLALTLGVAVYYAVFGGEYTLLDLHRVGVEKEELRERLQEEAEAVRELQVRVDSLENDPAMLERLARERFGLIREGEVLYRFAQPAEEAGEPPFEAEGWNRDPELRVDTLGARR